MKDHLGHRPPGPESPLPSPEGRENVPSYARLKGPEERGAELLTLLNIARDRQRGTLQLLGDLGPTVSRIMLSGSVLRLASPLAGCAP